VERDCFITITGTNYCYGMKPFEIGRIIRLVKETQNEHDLEAIRAELPFIDKVGYVANSPHTVAKGTISAGRLYDQIDEIAYAQVLFVTATKVICLVLEEEELESEEDLDQANNTEQIELKKDIKNDAENGVERTQSKIKGRKNKPKHRIGFRF